MKIEQFITENKENVVSLLKELCQIPAPSNHEEKRAEFCKNWFLENCGAGAYVDEAQNAIFPYDIEGKDELIVIMAHTDTVFPDLEPMPMYEEDGKLFCPGVGDDTANLAILMYMASYFAKNNLKSNYGILFVANSGEEGLGNLKGSRQIVKDFGDKIAEFTSFDGGFSFVCNNAVGSHRYEVEVLTEGGHSFGCFGNTNAIERLSAIINELYSIEIPKVGDSYTTYNVGLINGGTSVNTIAQNVTMVYEYRSTCHECLEQMKQTFETILENARNEKVEINVKLLGDRPCSLISDPVRHNAMTERALAALVKHTGITPSTHPASTDCNSALAKGIPAVCFGLLNGDGAHTRGEWVELASLEIGMNVAFEFISHYFND